jgi:hypothetical protein
LEPWFSGSTEAPRIRRKSALAAEASVRARFGRGHPSSSNLEIPLDSESGSSPESVVALERSQEGAPQRQPILAEALNCGREVAREHS